MKIKGLKLVALAIIACCCANAFSADYFDPLFRIAKINGKVWVLRPNDTKPILAQEDYRYPYGSKVIVEGFDPTLPKKVVQKNDAMVIFANDYQIKLGMDSVITTEKITKEGSDAKVVVGIEKGFVSTFITISNSKTGDEAEDAKIDAKLNALVFKTSLAEVSKLVERNEIRVAADKHGNINSKYKIESGSINLEGQQFKIVKTARKSVFEIFGNHEFTRISVVSGEVTARVNRGEDTPYHGLFLHGSVIKLWRSYTQIQKKLVVVALMTMPNGKVEHFQYIENPSEVLKSLLGAGDAVASNDEDSGDEVVEDSTDLDSLEESVDSVEETSDTTSSDDTSSDDDFFSDDDDFFSDDFDF